MTAFENLIVYGNAIEPALIEHLKETFPNVKVRFESILLRAQPFALRTSLTPAVLSAVLPEQADYPYRRREGTPDRRGAVFSASPFATLC